MQHDVPERKLRGNSGTEDTNSEPKNTVMDRELERKNSARARENSDMNAKVGSDFEGYEKVIVRNGVGSRNENGERLCRFCGMNDLIIKARYFHTRKSTNKHGCPLMDGLLTRSLTY